MGEAAGRAFPGHLQFPVPTYGPLAHSLGMRLGCGATLTELTRLYSHPFGLDEAHSLDDVLARSGRPSPEGSASVRRVARLARIYGESC